jgi:hypothetical protein
MMLIGLGAVLQGRTYSVGTLTQMGSGFFPVALGVILMVLGLLIAANAYREARASDGPGDTEADAAAGPEWRGWICILGGIAAFAVLGAYGGLLIATFAITFISALGDRTNTWRSALALAVIMSIIAVVVFWWALQLQMPLFGQS